MRIAFDCRLFGLTLADEPFSVINLVRTIIGLAEKDEFFLIFDQTPPADWQSLNNTRLLTLKPSAKTAAMRAIWYDLRLPALLSHHQINLFVGTCGYISLRTSVKQILVLNDMLSGESLPDATGWKSVWYKGRLAAMLRKASKRIIPAKALIAELGSGRGETNFEILPFFAGNHYVHHLSESEQKNIKEKFTGGAEFFYCEEGWNNTGDAVNLLLAFSAFKKRMQTSMKLLLAGKDPGDKDWKEKLELYRFREDVIIIPGNTPRPERMRLLFAAYGLIHLPSGPRTGILPLALMAGIPVIASPNELSREMAGDAALYCTANPGESLAQNLMRLYKDEKLRNECISSGKLISKNWDMETAARAFYKMALSSKD